MSQTEAVNGDIPSHVATQVVAFPTLGALIADPSPAPPPPPVHVTLSRTKLREALAKGTFSPLELPPSVTQGGNAHLHLDQNLSSMSNDPPAIESLVPTDSFIDGPQQEQLAVTSEAPAVQSAAANSPESAESTTDAVARQDQLPLDAAAIEHTAPPERRHSVAFIGTDGEAEMPIFESGAMPNSVLGDGRAGAVDAVDAVGAVGAVSAVGASAVGAAPPPPLGVVPLPSPLGVPSASHQPPTAPPGAPPMNPPPSYLTSYSPQGPTMRDASSERLAPSYPPRQPAPSYPPAYNGAHNGPQPPTYPEGYIHTPRPNGTSIPPSPPYGVDLMPRIIAEPSAASRAAIASAASAILSMSAVGVDTLRSQQLAVSQHIRTDLPSVRGGPLAPGTAAAEGVVGPDGKVFRYVGPSAAAMDVTPARMPSIGEMRMGPVQMAIA